MDYSKSYRMGLICKVCGDDNMRPYVHGFPSSRAWLEEDNDLIKIGTCARKDPKPILHCNSCETDVFDISEEEARMMQDYISLIRQIPDEKLQEKM